MHSELDTPTRVQQEERSDEAIVVLPTYVPSLLVAWPVSNEIL